MNQKRTALQPLSLFLRYSDKTSVHFLMIPQLTKDLRVWTDLKDTANALPYV